MAGKKSNKTAHVLNLISTPKAVQAEDEIKSPAQKKSHYINSLERNAKQDEISSKIKDNLLEELNSSLEVEATAPPSNKNEDKPNNIENNTTPKLEELENALAKSLTIDLGVDDLDIGKEELNYPNKEDNIIASPLEMPSLEIEDSLPATLEEEKEEIKPVNNDEIENIATNIEDTKEVKEVGFKYINVCEEIVKDKVMEYLEKFEVCTCSRCVADTMALTLTNLEPKYIVSDESELIPLLNYYENKFAISVMTELTKACLIVSNSPRHI